MTSIQAAALWIGLHVILMLALKFRVGATRARTKVNFGGGDNELMQRMMRVQGNAVEDVPIGVIGIGALGLMATPVMLIHGVGALLLSSRILHMLGLGGATGTGIGRLLGTLGSVISLLVIGGSCIWFALQ